MTDTSATTHWLTIHGLVTVLAILVYVITSHVMHQRRHPSAAVAWILFIVLLPYVALPAFLSFGTRKRARPSRAQPVVPVRARDAGPEDWVLDTLAALRQPPMVPFEHFSLHGNGAEARAALLDLIDSARVSIDLSTFILGRDQLGAEIVERLCARSRDGLRIRLLLDGMGRLMARSPRLGGLIQCGAQVTLFVPPLRSPLKGRTNLRNHRKMVIADAGRDGARLWCGGRNLAAEYFEGREGERAWRDLTFDLAGPLVRQAASLFEHDWAFARGEASPQTPLSAVSRVSAGGGAQIVASGPDQVDDTVYSLLLTAAYRAGERILLCSPYFVPEPALLMALCMAARRGVHVELLVPARSNHRLSDLARGRALRSLVQAGARVWLLPGMLHAKMVLVDDTLALVGSANLDSRSLFLNYELMTAFHGTREIAQIAQWYARERAPALAHRPSPPGLLRDIGEGMLLWLAFQL